MIGEFWKNPTMKALYHFADGATLTDTCGSFDMSNLNSCTFENGKVRMVNTSSQALKNTDHCVNVNAAWSIILNFSISALPATNQNRLLFSVAHDGSGGCEYGQIYYQDAGGTKQFHAEPGNATHYSYVVTLDTNRVYQIVYVNSGAQPSATYLYFNGKLGASGNNSNADAGNTHTRISWDSTSGWNGAILEAAFLQKALTAAEIRQAWAWTLGVLV
jgi:hypothetical protein